jgi:hypothetical protein
MSILAIDLNFLENWKFDMKIILNILFDLLISSIFLIEELIRGES